MIQKIFNFFNIQLQPYQGPLALSMFISVLLHAYFSPVICKTAITELPSQWLAFEGVWCCTASLLIGMAWKESFRTLALKSFIVPMLRKGNHLMMFVEGKWIKNDRIAWARDNEKSIFECARPHKQGNVFNLDNFIY